MDIYGALRKCISLNHFFPLPTPSPTSPPRKVVAHEKSLKYSCSKWAHCQKKTLPEAWAVFQCTSHTARRGRRYHPHRAQLLGRCGCAGACRASIGARGTELELWLGFHSPKETPLERRKRLHGGKSSRKIQQTPKTTMQTETLMRTLHGGTY